MVSMHAENGQVIDILVKQAVADGRAEPKWHPVTRPIAAEAEATRRAIALAEMPGVAKTLAQQKVAAVIVNNDDSQEKVTSFYAKKPPGAPVLYDVGSATREQWNVQSVPIAVYLTPSGKIAYQGEAVWAKLATAIESSQGLAGGTIKFSTTGTGFG